MKKCSKCKQDKDLEDFYQHKSNNKYYPYCKICTNNAALNRQHSLKKLAVEYKGGKCEKCGYLKYTGALEFHHKIPNEKDFNLSQKTKSNFNEEIRKELDKCILLCSNCHREIHHEIRGAIV